MTVEIALPAHSVVLVLGHARHSAPVSELCDRIPGLSCPFDIMKPDASHDRLLAALNESEILRVAMLRSHPKVRRKVAASARKRGFIAIALRLPGAEEVGADEGYAQIIDLTSPAEAEFKITPMPSDLSHMTGPFDIIGDVHGCADELEDLLVELNYLDADTKQPQQHPAGRTLVLLGDLTDRGPANLRVLHLVRDLEAYGALRVLGNHDFKAARWLSGNKVEIRAGIETTVAELDCLPDSKKRDLGSWLGAAQHHLLLDGHKLVVAHAGISEERQGSHSEGSVAMALYGLPTGELDEDGHPEAEDWALTYAGSATVVHGHVVYPEPRVVNNVVAIDTGCVFGGKLTAYRWPERDYVSVEARQVYCPNERLVGPVID